MKLATARRLASFAVSSSLHGGLPARRDGAPVDVDAGFEVPFHLAPRLAR